MTKILDEAYENTSELNEVKNQKTLCVHDLKKKLRVKQKRQFIVYFKQYHMNHQHYHQMN